MVIQTEKTFTSSSGEAFLADCLCFSQIFFRDNNLLEYLKNVYLFNYYFLFICTHLAHISFAVAALKSFQNRINSRALRASLTYWLIFHFTFPLTPIQIKELFI